MNQDLQNAVILIGRRYSENQITKAQDIIGDLQDEVGLVNEKERAALELVFDLLTECIRN